MLPFPSLPSQLRHKQRKTRKMPIMKIQSWFLRCSMFQSYSKETPTYPTFQTLTLHLSQISTIQKSRSLARLILIFSIKAMLTKLRANSKTQFKPVGFKIFSKFRILLRIPRTNKSRMSSKRLQILLRRLNKWSKTQRSNLKLSMLLHSKTMFLTPSFKSQFKML